MVLALLGRKKLRLMIVFLTAKKNLSTVLGCLLISQSEKNLSETTVTTASLE